MKRVQRLPEWLIVAAIIAVAGLVQVNGQKAAAAGHRIAVFGSSVANGTGDDLGQEGYTGRLRELLAPRGWEVLNQSRGGDNTKTMLPRFAPEGAPDPKVRYLLPVNPDFVLLGLSLGNEGIQNGTTKEEKDVIYHQFESGLHGFIARSREHHIVPIVTSCYTRNDFTSVEYEYTRRMNLLINAWDVPSVNFLGAVDDGTGKWAKGFWHDSLHPNAAGHAELAMTFVPTLFDALEQGKPKPVFGAGINSGPGVSTSGPGASGGGTAVDDSTPATAGFARIEAGSTGRTQAGARMSSGPESAITFTPDALMHPFAFGIAVRARRDGAVASISGSTLTATSEMKREERGGGRGALEFEATTLAPATPFTATVGVKNGMWAYSASNGGVVSSATRADSVWHHLVVSHYTARGETLFFVDGRLAGKTAERLEPKQFGLGGPGTADFKDLLIYRSALNADEVAALENDRLLQASLEVYAPLRDTQIATGSALLNKAQSLTSAKVSSGGVQHVVDK